MSSKEDVATVVKVKNRNVVIINKGEKDKVLEGDYFVLYAATGEKLKDPETGDDLGEYEEFKGEGIVIFTNENTSTIQSTKTKTITETSRPVGQDLFQPLWSGSSSETVSSIEQPIGFENPKKGDKARKI